MTGASAIVAHVRRYPVKSMLGEDVDGAQLRTAGVAGDRELALLDVETGHVATAKHPRLWRELLQLSARHEGAGVRIVLPDGAVLDAGDEDVDERLSLLLGRPVHLTASRPHGAAVERPAPEDVIAEGVEADVAFELLEIAQGSAGGSFVDYAPVHLISSSTVEHIGAEWVRYRPNLVISTPGGQPFAENDWVGRDITVGSARLRGVLPTPRCAVPTLRHGELGLAPHAVRNVLAENRVDVPGFGVLPCAGVYAQVVQEGTVSPGDAARIE